MDREQLGWLLEAITELRLSVDRMREAFESRESENRRIELEALITEREGMWAENEARRFLGQSPAYGDGHFMELASRMRAAGKEG